MAVSIVSKSFGDDSQPSASTIPSQDGSVSSVVAQDIAVGENVSPANNDVANETVQTQDIAVTANDDGQRLNELHPEEVAAPILDEAKETEESSSIPNMYIKADTDSTMPTDVPADVAIFSEEPKQEDVG